MPHDDPEVGKTIEAAWGLSLDDSGLYTPELTASSSNPNLGSTGQANGWWHRSGHRIRGEAELIFSGSGTAGGSGAYFVSLPSIFPPDTTIMRAWSGSGTGLGLGSPIGVANSRDNSAPSASRTGIAYLVTSGRCAIQRSDSGVNFSDSQPFSWGGDGDRLLVLFDYVATLA